MLNVTHTSPPDFPHAKLEKQTTLSFIWLVPVVAAVVAGVLVFQNIRKSGPTITIQFEDGDGLGANQTVIRYRGVRVGSVSSIQLTPDMRHMAVRARLDRSAAGLAREGTIFWIVRPEVGAGGFHALETIVSGPYIQALPGNGSGQIQKSFVGATEPPIIKQTGNGMEFVLRSPQIRSLAEGSPVYYRGIEAGSVRYLELNGDSTAVNVHVVIKTNFTPLVRANTVWWNAGGININWHLLSGINMTAENLRAVLTGGIAFATPNEPGESAPAGTVFALNEKSDDKWLGWSPHMIITNATASAPGSPASIDFNNMSQPHTQP
jgi:paraquat-inducible protein B